MKKASTILTKRRIRLLILLATIIMSIIAIRLAYVQFVLGKDISEKALDLWLRDIVYEPDRGAILDRHGRPLTTNVTTSSVIIIPHQIKDKQKVVNHLVDILHLTKSEAENYVSKRASTVRIHPKGRKISEEQERELKQLNLEGVYLAKDSKRDYPYDRMLSHVLGFTGIDNQGLIGLEKIYDQQLKGKVGSLAYFSDAKGGRIKNLAQVYNPPADGYHLKSTIDLDIQTIVERELDEAEITYRPDGSMAIVVQPKTGEVLALSSRPNFHPREYKGVPQETFNRNLPIWSTFEPGSTFKIITLAAAINEQLIDINKDKFFDKGYVSVGGARLRCWKKGGHGSQTMLEVAENSCNPGFVHIGNLLGDKKLFEYIKRFGFGTKTGIDLEGEGTGILFRPEQIGPVELATTSFGQGVSVTPIQQVMAVAAAVNGGYLYEPFIAKEWIDPKTNEIIFSKEPTLKRQAISKETSEILTGVLESVVAKGTGRPAYVHGYRVGGKTGTAQKVGPDGRYLANDHIVSFIGFAPSDDPQVVVYVALDNPKDTIQFGGVVAAPIVRSIIDHSLRVLEVDPRKDGLEKSYLWPEEPLETVPNLIGMHKDELVTNLFNFKLDYSGDGNIVLDQEPKSGTALPEGATIRLYFGK